MSKKTVELFWEVPHSLSTSYLPALIIGAVSLAILIGFMSVRHKIIKKIPAPLTVVIVSVLLAELMDVPTAFRVSVPINFWNNIDLPSWELVHHGIFWQVVMTIFLIQGLETLISASAVEQLDYYKRKANLKQDL